MIPVGRKQEEAGKVGMTEGSHHYHEEKCEYRTVPHRVPIPTSPVSMPGGEARICQPYKCTVAH